MTPTATNFGFHDLNDQLVERFSSLREGYENELRWRGAEFIFPHVVYRDFFTPHVADLLKEKNGKELRRAFDFVEVLAGHVDVRVQDVAALAVLQDLYLDDDKKLLRMIKGYMGPLTRWTLAEVQDLWEHPPAKTTRDVGGQAARSHQEIEDIEFSYEEFNDLLPKVFPILGERYQGELCKWTDPDPYTIYGFVFSPYLNTLIKEGNRDELKRALAFTEMLAGHEDERVQEVAIVEVLENLYLDNLQELRAMKLVIPNLGLRSRNAVLSLRASVKRARQWQREYYGV